MKIFSFIFSFYILLLTIAPVLQDMDIISAEKSESCCGSSCEPVEKKQTEEQSNDKEDGDKEACNPFQSCKCCIGFNPNFVFLNYTPIPLPGQLQMVTNERIPLQIALDFWQPPKIKECLL